MAAGTSDGQDLLFTTTPGIPTDISVAASEVHTDHAMLHAAIDPNGASTSYVVQIVDSQLFEAHGFENATTIPGPEDGIGMARNTSQSANW